MKYKTINELNHFCFSEAHIAEVRATGSSFTMLLDNVTILPENSRNRDIRQMRANQLLLTISDASIADFIEEGYKLYDADGNLTHQEEDKKLAPDQYAQGFSDLTDCTVYSVEKTENLYEISIDTEDHTCLLRVIGKEDTAEWDRFLNLNSEF